MVIHYHNIFLWYICLLKDTRKDKGSLLKTYIEVISLSVVHILCILSVKCVSSYMFKKFIRCLVGSFKGLCWGGVWVLLICFCGHSGQVGCIQNKIYYALHGSPSLGDCFSSWRKIQAEFRSTAKHVWLSGFIKILFSRRYGKF